MPKPSVTFEGNFHKMKPEDILRPIEGMLANVGAAVVPVMRGIIKGQVSQGARGELERSIAWRTANKHSQVEKNEDLIESPPVHCVDIGSANSHAFYVEEGSSPHLNPEGTEEFVAEIKDWTARMGWDEDVAYAIINSIRANGTDAMPYAKPTGEKLPSISKPIYDEAVRTFWKYWG
jgi:hypothetical protein